MLPQPVVGADENLESRWQCYVCRRLSRTKWRVRAHFYTMHLDVEECFQPGRVARVWCTKDSGRVVSLAPLEQQTPSFQGIAPELRALIFDHVLSLPKIHWQLPNPQVSALGAEAFALLSINHDTFDLAKKALQRNNFLVLFKVHASISNPMERVVQALLRDIKTVVPRNVADMIDQPALEANVFLKTETAGECYTTTSVLTFHDICALKAMVLCLCKHPGYIRVLNVDFQPVASQPRYLTAKDDIIRGFGRLQGMINLRVRDCREGFPSDIKRIPKQAISAADDRDLLLTTLDQLLQDIIAARRQRRNQYAMEGAVLGLRLIHNVACRQNGVQVNWNNRSSQFYAFGDIVCQLHLLRGQCANLAMWKAICCQKPQQIDIRALRSQIASCYTSASSFRGLSANLRAQAYLAKAVAFTFQANLLVRSDMRVNSRSRSNDMNRSETGDTQWYGGRFFTEPGALSDVLLSGPSDVKQSTTAPTAFRSAAKYFSLAAELLKEPFRTRAVQMERQIATQGRVPRDEFAFRCWVAPRDPYQEAWKGDFLEWRLFDFATLDRARLRPANWKSRVTFEDDQLDMEVCGLDIDLEELAFVCATY